MTRATRVFLCSAALLVVLGLGTRFAGAQAPGSQRPAPAARARAPAEEAHAPAAQERAPGITRLLVTTYRLKPDSVQTWMALEKDEVVPALKKAGVKSRAVYRTIVGEATEYQVRQPIAGFEVYDEPSGLERALGAKEAANLNARLAACLQSVHVQVENRQNEFFIDPGDAPVQFASKYRALPGKAGAYTVYFRDYMLPVFRQAKRDGTFAGLDYTVSQHGGEWGLITLNMYYSSFAPLDGEPPVAKTLGPQRTRELLAKGQGLIDPLEWIVRERVADLSF